MQVRLSAPGLWTDAFSIHDIDIESRLIGDHTSAFSSPVSKAYDVNMIQQVYEYRTNIILFTTNP